MVDLQPPMKVVHPFPQFQLHLRAGSWVHDGELGLEATTRAARVSSEDAFSSNEANNQKIKNFTCTFTCTTPSYGDKFKFKLGFR